MMSRRTFFAAAAVLAGAGTLSACGSSPRPGQGALFGGERSVGIGFEDVVTAEPQWSDLGRRLAAAKANALSLAVGRADWVGFPLDGKEQVQASLVRRTQRDYVREALDEITAQFPADAGPRVVLVIDALIPGWIGRDSEVAGVNPEGEKSESFASLAALATGPVGDALVRLADVVCARYRPDAIAMTELMFDDYTFGIDDLDHYRVHTGAEDWPRTDTGEIDVVDDAIARWRSEALSGLLGRIREVASRHGVSTEMDVRAPWDDPHHDRALSGHDYDVLLRSVDRLVVWNYFALNDRPPEYGGELTRALSERIPEKFLMSTGLWASGEGNVVSPEEMSRSLRAIADAGGTSCAVTPASLMTDDHWTALRDLWDR